MADTTTVGPYVLHGTLGKGQTGLVKLGIHCLTKKKVAIKIIDRTKLAPHILAKVEREITIMKLIDHPNVLGLFDVYENKRNLYLVLEHVSGGELFDYLVKRGRLQLHEARKFFRQIVSAIDFCHHHLICHRDLKPENLLLDEKKNIKIADFGMASLQTIGNMLETSCGSPHYACPEVIRGIKYDGKKADVWSCGIILYALVVGCLPFDDDNLRNLLEKVKKGHFQIPGFVNADCRDLIQKMVTVNPDDRYTMIDVKQHPFLHREEMPVEPPIQQVVETFDFENEADIDEDIVRSMTSLGCFKDKVRLLSHLMKPGENIEKIIYFLLLDRKDRCHSTEDDLPITFQLSLQDDPPRKRIDSPDSPHRRSCEITIDERPAPGISRRRAMTHHGDGRLGAELPIQRSVSPPGSPWRSRLDSLKSSLGVGSSQLRRRSQSEDSGCISDGTSPGSQPDLSVRKSWFTNLLFHASSKKVQPFYEEYPDRNEVQLKNDLRHVLLLIPKVSHTMLAPDIFRITYRRRKGMIYARSTIIDITVHELNDQEDDEGDMCQSSKLTATFVDGSQRKFRKFCENIRSQLLTLSQAQEEPGENGIYSEDELLTPTMPGLSPELETERPLVASGRSTENLLKKK